MMNDSESPSYSVSQTISGIDVHRTTSFIFDDERRETVNERIDSIGFGWYQSQVFILCAGFIFAEGAELQTASGIANAFAEDFNIDGAGRSTLMVLVFSGLALGTMATGVFGDHFGRRVPMLVGYSGIIVCALIIAACAKCRTAVYCTFFVLGACAGAGIPAALITMTEVVPTKMRGVCTAALGMAFSLGELWASIGLLLVMPGLASGPWRFVVLWSALPAAVLLCAGLCSRCSRYDTPAFCAVKRDCHGLVGAVNLMAEMNGRPDLRLETSEQLRTESYKDHDPSSTSHLFRRPNGLYLGVLAMAFFAKDFAFYGMGVFWPLVWKKVEGFEAMSPALELALTACTGIPGVFLALSTMGFLPRRLALAGASALCAGGSVALSHLDDQLGVGVLGVLLFKLFFPTWQMTTMLLPAEIFPTAVRGLGYSLVAFGGRIACILAPIVVTSSTDRFLKISMFLNIGMMLLVWVLPETKHRELADSSSGGEQEKNPNSLFSSRPGTATPPLASYGGPGGSPRAAA